MKFTPYKPATLEPWDEVKFLELTRGTPVEELRQSQSEQSEITINIDYHSKEIWIYTTNATVMRRICRLGYMPTKVEYVSTRDAKNPFSMDFRLPSSELTKFVRSGLFKR